MANKLFYSYFGSIDSRGYVPASDMIAYYDSIIFDANNRTLWHNGMPFGNAYQGGIFSSVFNDYDNNFARGAYSATFGSHTITSSETEFAVGRYNETYEGNIFEVGIGTDEENRHNAFTIVENGNAYHPHEMYSYLTYSYVEVPNDKYNNYSPDRFIDLQSFVYGLLERPKYSDLLVGIQYAGSYAIDNNYYYNNSYIYLPFNDTIDATINLRLGNIAEDINDEHGNTLGVINKVDSITLNDNTFDGPFTYTGLRDIDGLYYNALWSEVDDEIVFAYEGKVIPENTVSEYYTYVDAVSYTSQVSYIFDGDEDNNDISPDPIALTEISLNGVGKISQMYFPQLLPNHFYTPDNTTKKDAKVVIPTLYALYRFPVYFGYDTESFESFIDGDYSAEGIYMMFVNDLFKEGIDIDIDKNVRCLWVATVDKFGLDSEGIEYYHGYNDIKMSFSCALFDEVRAATTLHGREYDIIKISEPNEDFDIQKGRIHIRSMKVVSITFHVELPNNIEQYTLYINGVRYKTDNTDIVYNAEIGGTFNYTVRANGCTEVRGSVTAITPETINIVMEYADYTFEYILKHGNNDGAYFTLNGVDHGFVNSYSISPVHYGDILTWQARFDDYLTQHGENTVRYDESYTVVLERGVLPEYTMLFNITNDNYDRSTAYLNLSIDGGLSYTIIPASDIEVTVNAIDDTTGEPVQNAEIELEGYNGYTFVMTVHEEDNIIYNVICDKYYDSAYVNYGIVVGQPPVQNITLLRKSYDLYYIEYPLDIVSASTLHLSIDGGISYTTVNPQQIDVDDYHGLGFKAMIDIGSDVKSYIACDKYFNAYVDLGYIDYQPDVQEVTMERRYFDMFFVVAPNTVINDTTIVIYKDDVEEATLTPEQITTIYMDDDQEIQYSGLGFKKEVEIGHSLKYKIMYNNTEFKTVDLGTITEVAEYAEFNELTYNVSVSVSPAGKGTVQGSGKYVIGSNVTVTVTPASDLGNYIFDGWYDADDVLVSNDLAYTIEDIHEDATLTAKFIEINSLTINITNNGNAVLNIRGISGGDPNTYSYVSDGHRGYIFTITNVATMPTDIHLYKDISYGAATWRINNIIVSTDNMYNHNPSVQYISSHTGDHGEYTIVLD